MEFNLPLEAIIGMNFVRYDVLNPLMHRLYEHSDADELNIFVDLYSIVKPLFSDGFNIIKTSELELSADIINLCGHYRYYYSRYLGARTNFFLIYGTNTGNQDTHTLYRDYNKSFYTKYVSNAQTRGMIDKNMNILNLICKNLPDIYFYPIGDIEVSAYIQYILNTYRFHDKSLFPKMENMIITKDILPLQLIDCGCTVLRPRKSKGFDTSFTVSHASFWNYFIHEKCCLKMPIATQLPITYFTNLLAMTKVPERDMRSIKTIPTAYNYLSKGIELGYLKDTYLQSTVNQVLEILGVNANYTEFDLRWKAISARFWAETLIPLIPELKNVDMTYLHDPNGVKEIVSRYYQSSPIDLDRLNG